MFFGNGPIQKLPHNVQNEGVGVEATSGQCPKERHFFSDYFFYFSDVFLFNRIKFYAVLKLFSKCCHLRVKVLINWVGGRWGKGGFS